MLAAMELLTFFGLTHVGCYGAASLSGLAHMLDATEVRTFFGWACTHGG